MPTNKKKKNSTAPVFKVSPCRLLIASLFTMADIQPKFGSNRYYFLSCFGVYRKKRTPRLVKKKKDLFSLPVFRMKKSGTKPITREKSDTTKPKRILKFLSYKFLTTKRQKPIVDDASFDKIPTTTTVVKVVDSDPISQVPAENRVDSSKINHVPSENRMASSSSKEAELMMQKRLPFFRKIEGIRTGYSQPVSPEGKPPKSGNKSRQLSHSVSMPAPINRERNSPTKSKKKPGQRRGGSDPVVGMSIIIVTLIIMLLWGRLCAILCTSAWLYFVSRSRTAIENDVVRRQNFNKSKSGDLDFNSDEYKKKVVLEGFLKRNHRVIAF